MDSTPRLRRDKTRDVAEAQRSLGSLFGADFALAPDEGSEFGYEAAALSDPSLTAGSIFLGGICQTVSGQFSDVMVSQAIVGRHRWRVGKESGAGSAPFVIPADRELRAESSNLRIRTMRIPPERLREVAEAITGRKIARLRDGNLNEDVRYPHLIAQTLQFVESTLITVDEVNDLPLVRGAIAHQALTAVLVAFPFADLNDVNERPPAAPAVRRAAAYVDEHAHEHITVADIARAAGVSTRALQNAFQRAFGLSPGQYLRRVRLNGARGSLLESDPLTDSVGAIARRWGFAHAGRFSQCYLTEFGELPHQTLRR